MIYANNREKCKNRFDLFGKSKNQKLLCSKNGFLVEKPVEKPSIKHVNAYPLLNSQLDIR